MLGLSDLLCVLLVFSILLVQGLCSLYILSVPNDLMITVHILCKQYLPPFVWCMLFFDVFICHCYFAVAIVLAR